MSDNSGLDDLNFEKYEIKAFQMNLGDFVEQNKKEKIEQDEKTHKKLIAKQPNSESPVDIKQESEKKEEKIETDKKIEKAKKKYKLKARFIKTPEEIKVPMNTSELVVITKAKDLLSYIFQVTEKSPKKFRFTFIGKLQSLSLEYIENLIRANEVVLKKEDIGALEKRREYQKQAFVTLKLLEYFAMVSYENMCILLKQYIQIAKKGNDCKILLANWIKSDKSRFSYESK